MAAAGIPWVGSAQEWSAAGDPEAMLGLVLPGASDRKRRLFAVACCRAVQKRFIDDAELEPRDEDYLAAMDTAERFADGEATSPELLDAMYTADDSRYANTDLDEGSVEERRKACYGDDPRRLLQIMSEDRLQEMLAQPDPAAWFEENEYGESMPCCVDPFRDTALADAALVGETVGRKVLLLVKNREPDMLPDARAAQAEIVREIFANPFAPAELEPAWRTAEVTSMAESIYGEKAFDRMPELADALERAGCTNAAMLTTCRNGKPHYRGGWVLDAILGKE